MHLEKHVEDHLVKRVKARGGMIKKIVAAGSNFWPDRLVVDPTLGTLLVELKKPGGRLSAGQVQTIAQLRAAGARVEVLWTKEQVDDLFKD